MGNDNLHVMRSPTGDSWSVVKEAGPRTIRVFETRQAAITHGATLARDAQSGLYIHKPDGMIQEKRTYGHEKSPRKG